MTRDDAAAIAQTAATQPYVRCSAQIAIADAPAITEWLLGNDQSPGAGHSASEGAVRHGLSSCTTSLITSLTTYATTTPTPARKARSRSFSTSQANINTNTTSTASVPTTSQVTQPK